MTTPHISFGDQWIGIEDIVAIAERHATVALATSDAFLHRVQQGARFLEQLLQEDGVIYGVTTGFGDSCTVNIPLSLVDALPLQLSRFHGCGLGEVFDAEQGRAILAIRLASLAQGYSGVGLPLLERLCTFINEDIVPVIPQEGSVGASGDLTPLSYLAATLMGERDVFYSGERRAAHAVLNELGLAPLTLRPKEGLALMNGTAVMTALACLAFSRARYLAELTARITAMNCLATQGNPGHFDAVLFTVKPHPGQSQVAGWIRSDLPTGEQPRNPARLQDRYSLRCAPHVIGVLVDSLPWLRQFIENEINSANDNPIIDGIGQHVLHGGHFYGGHIAFAMDALKSAVASIADLLDRQLALLMDPKFNHGLPANVSGASTERAMINHGFKAVQIGASAWTAEALKLTMPAASFSRSTECHNQDKVSMGTIAARDALRVLQLTEQVAAACVLASTQALEIRLRQHDLSPDMLSPALRSMKNAVESHFHFVEEDRPLETDLRHTIHQIQHRQYPLFTSKETTP